VLSDLSPSSDKLHVYPNPASDYLQVKGGEPETLTRYTIVNPQGVEVQRGDVTSGNDIRIQRPLPKGVYILKLSGDKQAPQSIRFVID